MSSHLKNPEAERNAAAAAPLKNKNRGILYVLLEAFFFALMTFFLKEAGSLPTMEKALFRNLVASVVSLIILLRTEEKLKIKKGSLPFLILRVAGGTVGLICNFYAVDHLLISDANMLNKMSPFFAILFSIFILKEKAGDSPKLSRQNRSISLKLCRLKTGSFFSAFRLMRILRMLQISDSCHI